MPAGELQPESRSRPDNARRSGPAPRRATRVRPRDPHRSASTRGPHVAGPRVPTRPPDPAAGSTRGSRARCRCRSRHRSGALVRTPPVQASHSSTPRPRGHPGIHGEPPRPGLGPWACTRKTRRASRPHAAREGRSARRRLSRAKRTSDREMNGRAGGQSPPRATARSRRSWSPISRVTQVHRARGSGARARLPAGSTCSPGPSARRAPGWSG